MVSKDIEAKHMTTDAPPPVAAHPTPPKIHFHWIDWLRFLASCGVMAGHVRGSTWVEWGRLAASSRSTIVFAAFALSRLGYEAVIVFFVLSGFLVGGKTVERMMKGTFDLRAFTIDRCTRIYVPLVPALLLGWAVALICGSRPLISDFAWNLVGFQGLAAPSFADNAPLWSLSYEIWFYVLAGAAAGVYTLAGAARPWAFFVTAFALGVFVKLGAVLLFCWLLGAVAYALTGVTGANRKALLCGSVIVVPAGILLCQMASDTVSLKNPGLQAWLPSQAIASLLLALGVSMLVATISQLRPQTLLAIKVDRLGTRLAAFSYTLYLTHYPIMLLWVHYHPVRINAITAISLGYFAIQVFLCVLVALLVYLPFEAQTARVRHWVQGYNG